MRTLASSLALRVRSDRSRPLALLARALPGPARALPWTRQGALLDPPKGSALWTPARGRVPWTPLLDSRIASDCGERLCSGIAEVQGDGQSRAPELVHECLGALE